ncbi:DoxX family protein [Elizabethkingia anophelis]|uniref:Predicted membrane protein n=1 Tax=Elizabethkingia anophelis TaxID=1117645 RepID=A0A7Z7PVE8_9FLAO|nr:DoxX family protein [Elizabethkingia anophelis]MCT3629796.1 DoxX family protein [Elizabethkingia anophelis]MCT3633262.1 DoxX family protein [Elizabethkingia anophelis]MCT3830040.1 DoxX family protein [Elizabethkingia anophelis]MCT3883467.1 DoxX family protein [Elizabethkingia anophelis]MCT3894235.1 DoxX family protein [Elizabethkingia anophelis]
MKLLSILFSVFIIALLATKIIQGEWNWTFSGNLGMAVFIIFTGFSHFKFQKGMALMIPDFIPYKMFWVYFTGVLEIAAGIGLMIPQLRETTAILLIVFYVVVFIANINSSKKRINIFKADYTGPGMKYLYNERIPMQIILIAWTWYFGIYLH